MIVNLSIRKQNQGLETLHRSIQRKIAKETSQVIISHDGLFNFEGEYLGDRYNVEITPKRTQRQHEQYKSMEVLGDFEKEQGGFVSAYFNINEIVKDEYPNLIKSDYSRLMYMSTFIRWEDNRLQHRNGIIIDRKVFPEFILLSKNRAMGFLNKMIDNGLMFENEKHELFILPKLFYYGKQRNNDYITKDTEYTRLFRKAIRHLYENCKGNELGRLATIYMIMPFVNLHSNIISNNPHETDTKLIEPLGIKDLSRILGYDSPKRLKQALTTLEFESEDVFAFVHKKSDKDNLRIIVNPKFVFAGNNEQLQIVLAFFK